MGLSTNDDFLAVIAHQARMAYALQQLQVLQDIHQDVLAYAGAESDASASPHAQHALAYYTQQIERWREYRERLVGLGGLP